MSKQYLMGLDIGGGGGRCMLVDVESQERVTAYRSWSHPVLPESGGFGFDLDLEDIWNKLGQMAKEVVHLANITPDNVLGVATTCMRHGIIVIDQSGAPLLATPTKDARAAIEGFTLAAEHGEKLYSRTGHWPCPVFAATRLAWMVNSTPDDLAKTNVFFGISDWVAYVMTGEIAMEPSLAGETMLLDLESCNWADDLIAELNLPRDIFPDIKYAGEKIGTLTEIAATHFGLQPGTPVAVGGGDTQSGLLGAGIVRSGQIGVITGTTAPVQLLTDKPVIDPEYRLWTGQHIIPGLFVMESNAGQMGDCIDMFAQLLYPDASNPVEILMAEASLASQGSNGMISTLGAQIFNGKELGVPVGNLTLSHLSASKGCSRAELTRSILEGLAFALRANIEQIIKLTGNEIQELAIGGGMSRSPVFTKIVADVMNLPVRVVEPQVTSLGAAICAGVGAGVFDSLEEGALKMGKTIREHAPDDKATQGYELIYNSWLDLVSARKESDEKAGNMILTEITKDQVDTPLEAAPTYIRPKILVTADMDDTALDALRLIGDVEYASYRDVKRMLTGDLLVEVLQGITVFITEIDVVDAKALAKLPNLRLIGVCRANPVNVDIDACSILGIPVINTPGRNADAVADMTVAFMLMLARKFPQAGEFLREPGGEEGDMGRMGMAHNLFQGNEMWQKTVGIVGMGMVGKETAKRLKPFGARIIAYDPFITKEQAVLSGVEKVALDTLYAESDFITLHAPVTKDTQGMINHEAFSKMKESACLVNTARSALINTAALIEALESGKIGGAALDVFDVEPPGADYPLLAFPNLIATPHVAGNTVEVGAHQGQIVADELMRLLAKEKPCHVLNPEILEGFDWSEERKKIDPGILENLSKSKGPAVSDLEVAAKGNKTRDDGKKDKGSLFQETLAESDSPVRDHMERIFNLFVEQIITDDSLKVFSQDKDVVMHFIITDLGLSFFQSYRNGEVRASVAEPKESDVVLKMKAEILDGMFTGRVNGMDAAMSGKLSFSGDTTKAMTFQSIQNDMQRLYTNAREEIGDPGDLSKIGKKDPDSADGKEMAQGVVTGAPAIIKVGDVRDDILMIVNELFTRGLITGTGGNVSARVDGKDDEIWISPGQIFKGDLRADMMVKIDLNGDPFDPDGLSASKERSMHTAIYRKRPDLRAVIHSHAPMAGILDMTDTPFLPISTDAAFFGEMAQVPFFMPGSQELAEAVAGAIGTGYAVMMKNHGLIVAASSLRMAADFTDMIEVSSEALLACRNLGIEPSLLPEDIARSLKMG